MAVLARREWADFKSAVLARMGRTGDATLGASGGPVEHAIADAYFWCALTYFHQELLATTSNIVPASLVSTTGAVGYQTIAVWRVQDGVFKQRFAAGDAAQILATDITAGEPTKWARIDDTIYFDGRVNGALASERFHLLYVAEPTAPDFAASAGSELSRFWDEPIVLRALSLLKPQVWRFDMAGVHGELLQDFVGRSLHLPLGELPGIKPGAAPKVAPVGDQL